MPQHQEIRQAAAVLAWRVSAVLSERLEPGTACESFPVWQQLATAQEWLMAVVVDDWASAEELREELGQLEFPAAFRMLGDGSALSAWNALVETVACKAGGPIPTTRADAQLGGADDPALSRDHLTALCENALRRLSPIEARQILLA